MKLFSLLIELYFMSIFVRSIYTQGISFISAMFLIIFFILFIATICLCNVSNLLYHVSYIAKSISNRIKSWLIMAGISALWNMIK